MPNTQINDARLKALQNSKYKNWQDAYAEYSGKKGSNKEKREFKRDWKSQDIIKARIGEDNYNQLRAEAEQRQFGVQGYNSGSAGEQKRFDRRFNKNVSNRNLRIPQTPQTPQTSVKTSTPNETVIYPWMQNTYGIIPERNFQFIKFKNPVLPPTPIDYDAEGLKLLGKDYMASDNLTKIQNFLIEKKYDLGTDGANGKYGQKTNDALIKYFSEVGNAEGWKNINDLFKSADPADPPTGGGTSTGGANLSVVSTVPTANTQNQFNFDNFVNEQNLSGDNIISKNGHRYVRFDPKGSGDFYVGDDGNIYKAGLFGRFTGSKLIRNKDGYAQFEEGGIYSTEDNYTNNYNYLYNLINPVSKQKQGGKMNRIKYFQQGGQMQQQNIQQQIMQLVESAMSGNQKDMQTIQQVMQAAEQGDQQAIQLAQMIQQAMEQIKG